MLIILIPAVVLLLLALPAASPASDVYPALEGLKGVKAVFDVSLGSPQKAKTVFWAVRNVYEDPSVNSLPQKPRVAVVFHGPAVKLLSTEREEFSASDQKVLAEFADMIRQMKSQGVKIEVCGYALKVLGVDPATILPEVQVVGNGFISIVGYQAKGYSLVVID